MNSRFPVRPVSPAAPYIGGKNRLAERIVSLIHLIPHDIYAEAFVGMGGVFLRRNVRPGAEFINDYSQDVSNLFRILQVHFVPFMDMLKWQLTTRAEFDRLIATDPSTLTDLQRAARFLYLQRVAFGGKVTGRNFGMAPERPARFDITKLASILEEIHERLAGVTIERLHYRDFLEKYDHPAGLFYLDPPYYFCEKDYGPDLFDRSEFPRMAAQLAGLQARFLLSINDHPDIRDIFRAFELIPVETSYSVGGGEKTVPARELIITNAGEHLRKGDLFGNGPL